MPRTVLITGTQVLLARALAARYRAATDDLVLLQAPENVEAAAAPRVDDVWWLYGGPGDRAAVRTLLAALPALGARAFNLVGPAPHDLEIETLERCAASYVRCLIFRVAHLLGQEMPADGGQSELTRFLQVLDAVVAEVEERLPGYFRRQPLRCLAPAGATVDLAGADEVAGALLSIGRTGPPGYHRVVADRPTLFADLCERVGRAWGLDLAAVADDRALNAVDRHFRDRLAGINLLDRAPTDLPGAATRRVANLDAEAQRSMLRAFRERRVEVREAARARVAAMPELLERHPVAGIPALAYHAAGRGDPPLVALNAIGQGVAIWLPLLERLSRRRRVILCEMRQTDPNGRPITLAEHCDDLHTVLRQEGAGTSHLLGWCTGAKLAARYSRTHPGAVLSMVFLSGSFKHPGCAPGLDTAYERNFEAMCRAIVRQPSVAERLRFLFAPAAGGAEVDQLDDDELALRALTGLHPHLDPEVRRPFRDTPALVVYAQQHVEFWSHDETATAPQVSVPVLGIIGEHDQVVSPASLQTALDHFPLARYVEIAGATHYCLYDRPDLVAGLIEEFVEHIPPRPGAQF